MPSASGEHCGGSDRGSEGEDGDWEEHYEWTYTQLDDDGESGESKLGNPSPHHRYVGGFITDSELKRRGSRSVVWLRPTAKRLQKRSGNVAISMQTARAHRPKKGGKSRDKSRSGLTGWKSSSGVVADLGGKRHRSYLAYNESSWSDADDPLVDKRYEYPLNRYLHGSRRSRKKGRAIVRVRRILRRRRKRRGRHKIETLPRAEAKVRHSSRGKLDDDTEITPMKTKTEGSQIAIEKLYQLLRGHLVLFRDGATLNTAPSAATACVVPAMGTTVRCFLTFHAISTAAELAGLHLTADYLAVTLPPLPGTVICDSRWAL
ncbi:hypothetical protein HPB50_026322 [Hyalomma asiaticum]|uniref:Uncharacterized protein n=1 Tax=Hyalomma asiaticum TaxID=266040 RepID=A0ACB7T008_HYAAI|nr:hypothetical protein HPB50_026322 [Hyalomma asiaticum]